MDELYSISIQALVTVLTVVIPIVATLAVRALTKFGSKLNLDIDEKQKAALHTAIVNGLTNAIATGVAKQGVNASISHAVTYAQQLNPGAVKHFDLGKLDLEKIAEAKLPQVLNQTAVASPAPIGTN